jgi:pimeloyl-ACP methyl ester carboxylesterase
VREGVVAGPYGSIYYRIVGDADAVPLLVIHGGPGMSHDYLRDPDHVHAAVQAMNPAIYAAMVGTGLTFTGTIPRRRADIPR